jgi:prophage antirepressor-like protein
MANDLQLFDFNSHNIRVIEIDGDPWFVAKDVAYVLGYSRPNKAVLDHCKAASSAPIRDGTPGNPNAAIIPERDVYRLIMRSKLPSAEAFEDWVAGTVLPAIRKEGGYVMGEEKVQTEQDLMEMSLRTMDMLRKKLDEKSQQLGTGSRECC